ncbi:TolC family protein [Halomonas sp. AOP27-A1-41]|uniref:TolC family protein n=1 Tax=Halomonas sp. AOP27-A1-41 TaxID=3457707 RepID=UPI004034E2D9
MKLPGADPVEKNTAYAAVLTFGLLIGSGVPQAWAQEVESSSLMPATISSVPEESAGIQRLTLQEAVQRAVEWYPSVTESLGRLYEQNEQVAVARSGYFPQVNAGISSEYRTSSNQREEALNITASQLLYDFGKVSNDVKAELFGMERDQARVLLAIDELARETSQTVIEIQRYETLLEIADAQVAGITDIQALAAQRAEMGASTQSDQIQAQSRLEAAIATRLQLASQLSVSRSNLQRLAGVSTPVSVVQALPNEVLHACTNASNQFYNVPEVMVADAQQNEAKALIERRKADLYPTVSLEAGYNQFINPNQSGDDDGASLRVNLTSSLYRGGATRAQRRSADYALQAIEASKDNVLIRLQQSIQDAQELTRSAQSRIDVLDARASSITRTQELYRQQYLSLGTRSLLDLLNAEGEIHQSRFDQENARYDMYAVQMDCLYASSGFRSLFEISDDVVQGVSLSP